MFTLCLTLKLQDLNVCILLPMKVSRQQKRPVTVFSDDYQNGHLSFISHSFSPNSEDENEDDYLHFQALAYIFYLNVPLCALFNSRDGDKMYDDI